MNIYRNLILTGWFLFLVCLVLPSVTLKSSFGFSGNNDISFGFQAGYFSILAIPSIFDSFREFQVSMMGVGNIIALFSPLLLFKWNKLTYRVFFIFMSLSLMFAVKLSFVVESPLVEALHVGYYVWIISFLILSISLGRNSIKNS